MPYSLIWRCCIRSDRSEAASRTKWGERELASERSERARVGVVQ